MERVYEAITCGVKFGLYFRPHNSTFPYCVTKGNALVMECDNLGDANREYNSIQRIWWKANR